MTFRWPADVRGLVVALAVFLLAGCGSSGTHSSSATLRSDDVALAARGRVSLLATFKETSWRLPPAHSLSCINERRSRTVAVASAEPDIYCSLNSSAMRHLLRRIDRGLGTDVTERESSCISRKITRDQVAALLAAELGMSAADPPAAEAKFDDQLASIIRRCTNS